jgi:hypothetical protein
MTYLASPTIVSLPSSNTSASSARWFGHGVWKFIERAHKAAVAGPYGERTEEFQLQFKVLGQHRTDRHPATVGDRDEIDEVHRIAGNRIGHRVGHGGMPVRCLQRRPSRVGIADPSGS